MKSFFKYVLATVLGIILSSILLFFIFVGSIGAMISSQDQPVKIDKHTVLHLELSSPIADRSSKNPMESFDFQSFQPVNQLGLNEIIANIKKAKEDENIDGIYLDFTIIPAGMATIEEIRSALLDFKASGKFIISYADTYTQSTYYLASVADKVYLNPEGLLTWTGMRSEIMFFKEALEKIGIEAQIIRHGKFKSAVEPFMYNQMSDENREQVMTYMGSIWNHMLTRISESRNISIEQLNELADNLTLNNADAALEHGFVDGLKYKDEILAELKELTK